MTKESWSEHVRESALMVQLVTFTKGHDVDSERAMHQSMDPDVTVLYLRLLGSGWRLPPRRMEHGSMDHDVMVSTMALWATEPCSTTPCSIPWLYGRQSHAVEHDSMDRDAMFKTMASWTAEPWGAMQKCYFVN